MQFLRHWQLNLDLSQVIFVKTFLFGMMLINSGAEVTLNSGAECLRCVVQSVCRRASTAANPQHSLVSKMILRNQVEKCLNSSYEYIFPFSFFLMRCLKFTRTFCSSSSADVAYSSLFTWIWVYQQQNFLFTTRILRNLQSLVFLVPALSLLQNPRDFFCCGDDNIILDVAKDAGCPCYWLTYLPLNLSICCSKIINPSVCHNLWKLSKFQEHSCPNLLKSICREEFSQNWNFMLVRESVSSC